MKPYQKLAKIPASCPIERLNWYPIFHIPKNSAGKSAITTIIIVLFISILSLICEPFFVTEFGTNKKVSNASKVE